MYYPCSENKDADQLRGYREADLRLCFRISKKPVFSRRGSNYKKYKSNYRIIPRIEDTLPSIAVLGLGRFGLAQERASYRPHTWHIFFVASLCI